MYYPTIDPIIFSVGPLDIRWYGISYIVAFILTYLLGRYRIARASEPVLTQQQWGDIVFYGAFAAVLGGRIGYVLFYDFALIFSDPLSLLKVWAGGRSLHGGLLGVLLALCIYSKVKKIAWFQIADFVAPMVALGIGVGRLGNFFNTELPGRVTESVFGVHFPCMVVRALNVTCTGEYELFLRHVSSLYQAFVTGIVVFGLVWIYSGKPRALGQVSGSFLLLYGLGRFCTEFFREPDWNIGFILFDSLTMGQLLSMPMVVLGIWLLMPQSARLLEAYGR